MDSELQGHQVVTGKWYDQAFYALGGKAGGKDQSGITKFGWGGSLIHRGNMPNERTDFVAMKLSYRLNKKLCRKD